MRAYDSDSESCYPLYRERVNSLVELLDIQYPTKYFVLLLAGDYSNISSTEITNVAKKLIDKGLSYICAWGPECEKAHDAFDNANILWQEENGKEFHVMSTWHANEELEETIWFAIYNAMVDDEHWDKCSTIFVSVNNESWAKTIEESLSDIPKLNEKLDNA